MEKTQEEYEKQIAQFIRDFATLRQEVAKMIVGYEDVVEKVLICLFAGGNVLLEGVPGLGKTMLVRVLAQALHCHFRRVQFTADLMPSDILGTNMIVQQGGRRELVFQKGPIFTHLLLADEINRATPRTQSALLEAMEEHSVTVGAQTHTLEEPFFVLATQNPIEQAGTYPLPQAALDKFLFKLVVGYPGFADLEEIIRRTTQSKLPEIHRVMTREKVLEMSQLVREVPVSPHVERYAGRLVLASHPESPYATEMVKRYVKAGSSPRGIVGLLLGGKVRALLSGRFSVSCEDIRNVATSTLRHRVQLTFEGQAEEVPADRIVDDLVARTPEMEVAQSAA
ncbi:MAG: AAA family ATPase [Planctomycetes bacterium]|nr:AAA family ATPase [Planctomycetota bacterium]